MTKVYYRILNENDEDIVSSFVAEHYLPNETTIKCFRLGSDLIRKYALYYTIVLRQDLSIGAFSEDEHKLCGLVLNSNQNFEFQEKELKYKEKLPSELQLQIRIADSIESFFQELKGTTFLYLEILAVDKKYSGLGIGTELTRRCVQLAMEHKLDRIITFDTSPKSLSIDLKLGMKVKAKINMLEYEDVLTRKKIFQDCDHPEFWLYVMQLSLKTLSKL